MVQLSHVSVTQYYLCNDDYIPIQIARALRRICGATNVIAKTHAVEEDTAAVEADTSGIGHC